MLSTVLQLTVVTNVIVKVKNLCKKHVSLWDPGIGTVTVNKYSSNHSLKMANASRNMSL